MYEKRLLEVLHSNHIDYREADPWLDAAISRCAMCGFQTYIYGAGKDVDIFVRYLEDGGVMPRGIIDRNPAKHGEEIENIRIISPEAFNNNKEKATYIFIYCFISHGSLDEKNIMQIIKEANVTDYCFVGESRYSICGYIPGHAIRNEGRRAFYREHEKDLLESLSLFEDRHSKETFIEYIRTYMECSVFGREILPMRWKYFKGEEGKDIYKKTENEVWINCGADEGGTITNYFLCGLDAKKIYAMDGNEANIAKLKYYLRYYPERIRNRIVPICIYIDEDNKVELKKHIRMGERITLINADIEGAELAMLKGLQEIIVRDRPVLAICVYHWKEDLITIPKYINSIVDEYHFVLRKYASWLEGDTYRAFELVMYAIPKERRSLRE